MNFLVVKEAYYEFNALAILSKILFKNLFPKQTRRYEFYNSLSVKLSRAGMSDFNEAKFAVYFFKLHPDLMLKLLCF